MSPDERSRTLGTRPWYRRTWKRLVLTLIIGTGLTGAVGQGFLSVTDFGSASTGGSNSSLSATGQAVTEYSRDERGDPIELSGTTLAGERLAVESLRGSIVVVNVWGSWCAPCREEAPVLARAARTYADDRVAFVGINVRDNQAAAEAFESKYRIPYPSIGDFDGQTLLGVNDYIPVNAVPVTLVLDREGRVAARVLGALREATLTALLKRLLAESTKPSPSPSSSSSPPSSE